MKRIIFLLAFIAVVNIYPQDSLYKSLIQEQMQIINNQGSELENNYLVNRGQIMGAMQVLENLLIKIKTDSIKNAFENTVNSLQEKNWDAAFNEREAIKQLYKKDSVLVKNLIIAELNYQCTWETLSNCINLISVLKPVLNEMQNDVLRTMLGHKELLKRPKCRVEILLRDLLAVRN